HDQRFRRQNIRTNKNIKAGDIVLLHDTSDKSINVLKRLLKLLDEKGLHSVTIDELANIKGYA
ncbi:MAG: hypothetical protein JKY42_05985, partial [Flavobacteriales bacterium]|nr:hypothetical protein [Flavobacteriales bacterium]